MSGGASARSNAHDGHSGRWPLLGRRVPSVHGMAPSARTLASGQVLTGHALVHAPEWRAQAAYRTEAEAPRRSSAVSSE